MQNPFTMKHATDQMPSQNSSKITMIEMVEFMPQKKSQSEFYIQQRRQKLTYRQENLRMVQPQQ